MTVAAINVNKASAKTAISGYERWRLKWPGFGFDFNLKVNLLNGISSGLKAEVVEPDELGLSPSPAGC
jgi:hypothetical protein